MITQYNFIKAWLTSYAKTERGASLVEYALLVALIAVACIAAVTVIGGRARDNFDSVGDALTTTTPSGG